MYLSVVVPCFNEEDGLSRLYDALMEVVPKMTADYEVVFVDDGSTDATLAEMRTMAAVNPRCRYVALSRNFGKEAAILAGLRHSGGNRVAIMDADLQHPPVLLARMLDLLESGNDQVVACRTREGERFLRAWLAKWYYRGINRLSDVRVEDGVGDFRMLSRRAVEAILSLSESNRFSKGLFAWIGFSTVSIPLRNVRRECGRSKWAFGALVNHGVDGLMSFNAKPLRIAIYAGILSVLTAFGYGALTAAHALTTGVPIPGYAALLVVTMGAHGSGLLCLGVIGEYLGKIYVEVKRRPHFLVREANVESVSARRPLAELPG